MEKSAFEADFLLKQVIIGQFLGIVFLISRMLRLGVLFRRPVLAGSPDETAVLDGLLPGTAAMTSSKLAVAGSSLPLLLLGGSCLAAGFPVSSPCSETSTVAEDF